MKKIGIMGTESTGKTSLAVLMRENLIKSRTFGCDRIEILRELSRKSPGKINEESTTQNQQWIYHSQFVSELSSSILGVDILICDRTVLDPLVYSCQLGYHDFVDANIENTIKWLETYDVLYFKRPYPGISGVDDGVRSNNPTFREEVDALFSHYIVKYNIDVIESF